MKYYKYDKISKCCISDNELNLWKNLSFVKFARKLGYINKVKKSNASEYDFEILKYFDSERLLSKMYAKQRRASKEIKKQKERLKETLSNLLKVDTRETLKIMLVDDFLAIGSEVYDTFSKNRSIEVDILSCDLKEFYQATYLTRREIFNPKKPLTIVKYKIPKTITLSSIDIGERVIEGVLGFCIWSGKIKIFIKK